MFTIYRFNDFELNRLAEFISGPAGPFSLPPALRPSTNAKSIRHCPFFQSKCRVCFFGGYFTMGKDRLLAVDIGYLLVYTGFKKDEKYNKKVQVFNLP